MRLFLLLFLFLMTGSAFSQDRYSEYDYNRCLNAWEAYDGALSYERAQRCHSYRFAACMASFIDLDGAISRNRINYCAGVPNGGDQNNSCHRAWTIYDGALSEGRIQMCQRPAFAACMTRYIQLDGVLTEGRIAACANLEK